MSSVPIHGSFKAILNLAYDWFHSAMSYSVARTIDECQGCVLYGEKISWWYNGE